MSLALGALIIALQAGSVPEAGVFRCLLGTVPADAGYDDLPPRLDRPFDVTINGLRRFEEDGVENLGLVGGRDYMVSDADQLLAGEDEELVVNMSVSNQLVIFAGTAGGQRVFTVSEQPLYREWHLARIGPMNATAPGPELRGVCYVDREWPWEPRR